MSTAHPAPTNDRLHPDVRIAIIAARFNADIVDRLLEGCLARFKELGLDESRIDIHRVPGAFELPVACKWLASGRRFNAVIALGCVIRGDTPHFDFVAGEAARGISNVAIETMVPVIFGVLTTETHQQALDRS
ncbi:MAG TPA: 6,7-dimethyl-8-ribityllumazine synthase, partial [Tepidisphaeraceae bacterium]|nr:6,7-dimethyl-8-ribityllumazine synthase [Tepidisphaeraceae bacterium]